MTKPPRTTGYAFCQHCWTWLPITGGTYPAHKSFDFPTLRFVLPCPNSGEQAQHIVCHYVVCDGPGIGGPCTDPACICACSRTPH